MYLSRIQIKNFRNFLALDVALDPNVVVVGENRVGKSNLIFALRLVLDATLPESARNLRFADICDGCSLASSPAVSIDLDFADFDGDPGLVTLLTDYRLAADHKVARLSYIYRKKAETKGPAKTEADYEFKVYGGGDEARGIGSETRRRICLDLLHALRDAEGDLATWRHSPLRLLLEDAIGQVPQTELDKLAGEISATTKKLEALPPVKTLEDGLRARMADLAGKAQDIKAKLGFAPSDPLRLFRSIGLFIDDGRRSISDASLGSANLALLTLKLAEFAFKRSKKERNYTLVCIEEPEAHLHPHLQRQVFQKLFEKTDEPIGLFLTTHSPVIASITPLKSIVLLKQEGDHRTRAYSLARLQLSEEDMEDLQRYLDSTHAELLFSRGVLFVEGDAETALMPVFAKSIGIDLDEHGISICNVGGVNFSPYVKLATALNLPFSVITDWDPLDGKKPPLGQDRAIGLINDIGVVRGKGELKAIAKVKLQKDHAALRVEAEKHSIFLNQNTLEVEVASTKGLLAPLLSILEEENFGAVRRKRIETWKKDPKAVDAEQLLAMIADIGKGRLAGRLAKKAVKIPPPAYIASAIKQLISCV